MPMNVPVGAYVDVAQLIENSAGTFRPQDLVEDLDRFSNQIHTYAEGNPRLRREVEEFRLQLEGRMTELLMQLGEQREEKEELLALNEGLRREIEAHHSQVAVRGDQNEVNALRQETETQRQQIDGHIQTNEELQNTNNALRLQIDGHIQTNAELQNTNDALLQEINTVRQQIQTQIQTNEELQNRNNALHQQIDSMEQIDGHIETHEEQQTHVPSPQQRPPSRDPAVRRQDRVDRLGGRSYVDPSIARQPRRTNPYYFVQLRELQLQHAMEHVEVRDENDAVNAAKREAREQKELEKAERKRKQEEDKAEADKKAKTQKLADVQAKQQRLQEECDKLRASIGSSSSSSASEMSTPRGSDGS